MTVQVRTTARQIHFVTFFLMKGGERPHVIKIKKMDQFKGMTGMGTLTGRHKQTRKKKERALCFSYL